MIEKLAGTFSACGCEPGGPEVLEATGVSPRPQVCPPGSCGGTAPVPRGWAVAPAPGAPSCRAQLLSWAQRLLAPAWGSCSAKLLPGASSHTGQLHSSSFPGLSLCLCKMLWPKHIQNFSQECSEQVFCVCVSMQVYTQKCVRLLIGRIPFISHFKSINSEQKDPWHKHSSGKRGSLLR